MENKKVKPFGLTISTKVALDAIQKEVAPISVIIGNLFFLQKEKFFPKDLNVDFFSTPKHQLNENERKSISVILDAFKKPGVSKQDILESHLIKEWVVKKSPPVVKQTPIKKTVRKPMVKKPTTAPIVTVKKKIIM